MAVGCIANLHATQEQVGTKATIGFVLYDGSGNIVSSFGGGTQYTEGDSDSTPTGTAAMGLNPSNLVKSLKLDASDNLKVSAIAGGLSIAPYDYVSLAVAATTDTYTFKSGGAGGTTVATVVITYTDSTKATLSTVVKT